MNSSLQRISKHPLYAKMYERGKLFTITGLTQAIVQLLGLLSGIMIIRLLSIKEYAFYTLANTMIGTMTILADGGISSGVMSQGGKVWQNRKQLGMILSTGLRLRQKFALYSLCFAIPVLIYFLVTHGADLVTITAIVVCMVPAFYAAISDSLLETIPKLHQDINPLQKNQLIVATGRLLLIGASILLFPFSAIAILGNGIPRIYGNIKLRKIADRFAERTTETSLEAEKKILKIVKRLLPTAIYYCFSGQITIWLIGIFGDTTSIAQIGALGRLAVILNLLNTLFSTLIIPRFSRLPEQKGALKHFLVSSHMYVLLICLVIVSVSIMFSSQVLLLLGKNYSGLQYQFGLSITGSCMSLLTGLIFSMYISRGWAIHPAISIPINIVSIICAVFLFNVKTLDGVLWLNIFTAFTQYVMNLIFISLKIRKVNVV